MHRTDARPSEAPFQYRVTKYDPAKRHPAGHYPHHEWTEFCDVGKSFGDEKLTLDAYERVELAYISVAIAFMEESEAWPLNASAPEYVNASAIVHLKQQIDKLSASDVFRSVLRNEYWASFERGLSFVHFGWDYYMYIGVGKDCPGAIALAQELGLFVEPFASPYAEDQEDT